MTKVRIVALTMFTCIAMTVSAAASTITIPGDFSTTDVFTLHVWAVDDDLGVFITNANYSNQLVTTLHFAADHPTIDLSGYVAAGSNDVYLQLVNTCCSGVASYSYDYVFQVNGAAYDSGSCGVWNTVPCSNGFETPPGDTRIGIVWERDIVFNAVDSSAQVPEPATISLLGSGLVLAIARRRQKAFKNGGV